MSIATANATAKSFPVIPARWSLGLGLCLAALLLACLYFPLATPLVGAWFTDDNYTHGPLVVLAAVGLAVHALRRRAGGVSPPLFSTSRRDRAFGFAMVAVALLLHGVAWLLGFILLDVVSLVTLLLAGALFLGGRALRRDLGLPILLLLFAAPLPVAWYQPLALGLQNLVSGLSATFFALGGLSVYREGYVIHLSGMALEVGAACSGMRQLTAYLALGAVLGHLANRGGWFTASLLVFSAIMAVAANLLRILLTGVLMLVAGPQAAAGVFHTLEGLATLAIGAVGLLVIAVVLARLQDRRRRDSIHHAPREEKPHAEREEHYGANKFHPCFAMLLLTLLGAAAVTQAVAQRAVDADPAPRAAKLVAAIDKLPRQLGPWQGIDAAVPKNIAWADQCVRRDYRHRETGQVVAVWIAYSHVGADRAHHPEICMAVAGRSEDRRRRTELPLSGGPPIAEFVFKSPGDALSAWYWHYALPDVRSASLNLLVQTYHRARARRASVTVELTLSDDSSAGRNAARQLVGLVDEALWPMLPPRAVRGSSRLPVGVTALVAPQRIGLALHSSVCHWLRQCERCANTRLKRQRGYCLVTGSDGKNRINETPATKNPMCVMSPMTRVLT